MVATVNIDAKALLASLVKLPNEVTKSMRVAVKDGLQQIVNRAKRQHRFITRSGNAERSIIVEFDNNKMSGSVDLNPTIANAPYIRRLHEGGKNKRDSIGRKMTNKPDPFLYDAFDDLKGKIVRQIEDDISLAIKKAGF